MTVLLAIAAVVIHLSAKKKNKTATTPAPQQKVRLVAANKKNTTTAFAIHHHKAWQLKVKIIYVCHICYGFVKPYKFSDVGSLLYHLKYQHQIVLHPSKGKRDPYFKDNESYYKYLESNWDVVNFGCPCCSFNTGSIKKYKRHLQLESRFR